MNQFEQSYASLANRIETAVLSPLLSLSESAAETKQDESSWSFIELSEHLYLVEREVLEVIEKKLGELERSPELGLLDSFRFSALQLILRLPLKIKVPVDRVNPKGEFSAEQLVAAYRDVQQRYRELLSREQVLSLGQKAVFRHPIAGWMRLGETLAFIRSHLAHHQRQLEACKKLAREVEEKAPD